MARLAFILRNVAMELSVAFFGHGLVAIIAKYLVAGGGKERGGAAVEGVAGQAIAGRDWGMQIVIIDNSGVTVLAEILGQGKRFYVRLRMIL